MHQGLVWMLALEAAAVPVARERHVWAERIRALEVDSVAGDVHVEGGAASIEVDVVPVEPAGCAARFDTRDGVARVRILDATGSGHCRVHLAIRLPDDAAAEVRQGRGRLHVVDTAGALGAWLGAGPVALERAGPVQITVGAGRIEGDVRGPAELEVGAGSIDVHAEQGVRARTGDGDLHLRFTREPTSAVQARAGRGDVLVELPAGGVCRSRVDVRSGDGVARVQRR